MIKNKLKLDYYNLVCSHIYELYGAGGCRYLFDPKLIAIIKFLRDNPLKRYELIVNNWADSVKYGSTEYSQRGLYCNCCAKSIAQSNQKIPDVNAHTLGKAVDFQVYDPKIKKFVTAESVAKLILEKSVRLKVPHHFNMKVNTTDNYIHIDTLDTFTIGDNEVVDKITEL